MDENKKTADILHLSEDRIMRAEVSHVIDELFKTGQPQPLRGIAGQRLGKNLKAMRDAFEALPEEEQARRRAAFPGPDMDESSIVAALEAYIETASLNTPAQVIPLKGARRDI